MFIGNIVHRAGHKDFLHPLQAIFMSALITDWNLNLAYILFESMHTLIPNLPSRISQLTKLFVRLNFLFFMGCYSVMFHHFDAHLTPTRTSSITSTSIKLMNLPSNAAHGSSSPLYMLTPHLPSLRLLVHPPKCSPIYLPYLNLVCLLLSLFLMISFIFSSFTIPVKPIIDHLA